MKTSTVYLIHFDQPYKHARHYMGSASRLKDRLAHHANGSGSNLMRVITEAGITWRLVRKWKGGKQLERRLKNRGSSVRHCPICRPLIPKRTRSRKPPAEAASLNPVSV